MGSCNCATREEQTLHKEENIITSHEHKLRYFALSPREILNTFRRFTNNGKIEKPGFLEALASLSVNINGISNQQNPVHKLYANFEKHNLVDYRFVTTMGILLSKYESKEECIFDHYDSNQSGSLTEDEIDTMLTDVFLVCASFLTEFAMKYDKTELLSQYVSKMRQFLLSAIMLGKAFILNGSNSIPKDTFVERMTRCRWFRSTSAVRQFMMSSGKPFDRNAN